MMLRFLGHLPPCCFVAVSGGCDSMAVLSFLSNRKTKPTVAYFNHGTAHGAEAEVFVRQYCADNALDLIVGHISRAKAADESPEEHWRNERYAFLEALPGPVVTAHNLDDVMETWIFTSLHGEPRLIPQARNNVTRPFLLTPKSEMREWCVRKNIPWIEDPSNKDVHYMRNHIRHNIVPAALVVNPGLRKVLFKKLISTGVSE
jgi:tRNA(Ile)-lysidine synthase